LQLAANGPFLATAKDTAQPTEIDHLTEIFHSLTAGQLTVNQTATAVIGRLCWQNEEAPCQD
jgi:hypothetical protein